MKTSGFLAFAGDVPEMSFPDVEIPLPDESVKREAPEVDFQGFEIPLPDESVKESNSSLISLLSTDNEQHIINGKITRYGDHPYVCSLHRRSSGSWRFTCGAAILDENNVMTAAHCVSGRRPSDLRVRCGDFHLINLDQYEQTKAISAVRIHGRYSTSGGYPNDIALLKVATPLEFNGYVNTLPLATKTDNIPTQCQLIGWGKTETGQISYELRDLTINRLTTSQCQSVWGSLISPGKHICFMNEGVHNSACNGDSGGPSRCGNLMVGLTSWGVKGCVEGYPSVYTRLARHERWIKRWAFKP